MMQHFTYRFICQKSVNFGQAIYVTGNIKQLGSWEIQSAIRLQCYLDKYWIVDIQIPIDTQIQYKYFISSFDHHYQKGSHKIVQQKWIGNTQDSNNFKLFFMKRDAKLIQDMKDNKNLKIMSFNLRYQNNGDKNQYSWQNRKQNCAQIIKEHLPSIIGVQQARHNQRNYLQKSLCSFYKYIGVSRNNDGQGQQAGIFYDQQRFLLIDFGFKWISETGLPGSAGFGSLYPRYFTYIILEDTYTSQKFTKQFKSIPSKIQKYTCRSLLMAQNVHLDHLSQHAREKGVQMMSENATIKKFQFQNQIQDLFMLGDFNCEQNSSIFKVLEVNEPRLESIRKQLTRKNMKTSCDFSETFHNFSHNYHDFGNKTIDHLFISTLLYQAIKFEVIKDIQKKDLHSKNNIISDHFPIMGTFRSLSK